uniref:Uncharacterized protein n=1 Tax=Rhizophora mucronata TaxID=61149 RepID=A0A2P2QHB5_RHIMU
MLSSLTFFILHAIGQLKLQSFPFSGEWRDGLIFDSLTCCSRLSCLWIPTI